MLLIEACNIKIGGGLVLLEYLVKNLKINNVRFKIIINKEIEDVFQEDVYIFNGSYLKNRNKFIKQCISDCKATKVLYFGNFPPGFRNKNVQSILYIQNAFCLFDYNKSWHSFKENLGLYLRYLYLKLTIKNADIICFQTEIMKQKFIKKFKPYQKKIEVLPFFDFEGIKNTAQQILEKHDFIKRQRFIYVSSSSPHKNHKNLFEAWNILAKRGLFPELLVTLPSNSQYTKVLKDQIQMYKSMGIKINDLGHMSFEDILLKVAESEFCIFPSLLETIGLGLIEGSLMRNKVLAANMDYLQEIITPSDTFDPHSAESIANTIENALNTVLPITTIKLSNKINEFVKLLS